MLLSFAFSQRSTGKFLTAVHVATAMLHDLSTFAIGMNCVPFNFFVNRFCRSFCFSYLRRVNSKCVKFANA
jgi:hypothetical protein